jgi:hypothetical protein
MRKLALATVLVLFGCGAGPDPATAPRALTPLALEPPPIYSLLGFRQEIGLDSEQITRLDSIAEGVRRLNAPLVQELRERTPARAQQRGIIVVDTAGQPLLEQLRENNRAAAAATGETMTPEQRTTACRLFNESQRDRAGRRAAQQRQPPRQQGMVPADTLVHTGRGWPWCMPATAATDTVPGR